MVILLLCTKPDRFLSFYFLCIKVGWMKSTLDSLIGNIQSNREEDHPSIHLTIHLSKQVFVHAIIFKQSDCLECQHLDFV